MNTTEGVVNTMDINFDNQSDFPLRLAGEGALVRITGLNSGRVCHGRLAGLGLGIGSEIRVIRNDMHGKILVGHNSTRLYLGGGMAHHIHVVSIHE